MGQLRLPAVARSLLSVLHATNQYFQHHEPWALRKTGAAERCGTVLHICLEALRVVGILAQPLVPGSMHAMLDSLNVPSDERSFRHARFEGTKRAGVSLKATEPLFRKYRAKP